MLLTCALQHNRKGKHKAFQELGIFKFIFRQFYDIIQISILLLHLLYM